jgi:hypothetical protein
MNRGPARSEQAPQSGEPKGTVREPPRGGGAGLAGGKRVTELPRPPVVLRQAGNTAVSRWVERQSQGLTPDASPKGAETQGVPPGTVAIGFAAGGALVGAVAGSAFGTVETGLGAAAGSVVGLAGALLVRRLKRQSRS